MNLRERIGAVAAGAVLSGGIGASPFFGPLVTLPATAAVAALVWVAGGRPRTRTRAPAVTCAAAVLSLGVTLAALLRPPGTENQAAGMWALAESMAFVVLIGVVARWSPARRATVSGLLAGLAVAVWLFRFFSPSSLLEGVGVLAFWSAGSMAAAGVGLYLRSLDTRRVRAVAEGRRAQRLQLARDLHDFIAHDISEMIVQAQAGQVVGPSDPGQAMSALRRIEQAGLQAMAAMDRTVHMLNDDDEDEAGKGDVRGGAGAYGASHDGGGRDDVRTVAPVPAVRPGIPQPSRAIGACRDGVRTVAPVPTLADLPRLVARFSAAGPAEARLEIRGLDGGPGDGPDGWPVREVSATAYRVVVEALTNVRRHAPAATRVDIAVTREHGALTVNVRDDGGGAGPGPVGRHGGFGLPGLTERVETVGGTLRAGAVPDGWILTAVFPVAGRG
ncbi:sensor histidine kinase [Streptosporangium minutum]|uniref:sensor histidine kinase n=1 Tax=Streptosporangium minutum TaxID=569862 RepID=UPI001A996D6D|nr:sensor histidine kinase [Streptosporangium minutum]